MNKFAYLVSSASVVALTASSAHAYVVGSTPVDPRAKMERIARLPQQTDMNLVREFTVFLKPGGGTAADAVVAYFSGFGFQAVYQPVTNSVKLHGTFAQAAQAGHFTYVPGRLSITPVRTSTTPTF